MPRARGHDQAVRGEVRCLVTGGERHTASARTLAFPGAMVGGLLIGLGESYATGYVSSTYQDLIVFLILIFVILVRPWGLFGTPPAQKV